MSDCFVLYLLLTCMKKKTSGADKFTNNREGFAEHMKDIQKHNPDIVLIVGDFVDLISELEKNKVHVMQDDVELEASYKPECKKNIIYK